MVMVINMPSAKQLFLHCSECPVAKGLRKQALDWLRTDVVQRGKLLDNGTAADRAAILSGLRHRQQDANLAGIRDAAALAKLPAEEQKAFTQLWADVVGLLKKAEEKPK